MKRDVAKTLDELRHYVECHDYAGYDPYDAMNSPTIKLVCSYSKWFRLIFTQLLRRSPVNLRPLLGVKCAHNPKGIGLFLWGYAKLYKMYAEPACLQKIHHLLDLLGCLRSVGYSGNCWGYNFDWQSMTFLRPKGTPTVVNTSFIGHALLDCYEHTGLQRALDMAIPIKEFILNDLHRTKEGKQFCFSYTPVDTSVVHNANMLGGSILIRLFKHCGDSACKEDALSSLGYSMHHQNEDGSWRYGETEYQKWIDSFHTGFNLQALRYFLNAGEALEYRSAYERGLQYYTSQFYLEDGTPKYYHNRVYPIDIHAPAQAISFLSGMGKDYRELTEKILTWTLNKMLSSKGYFFFRKTPFFTNTIPYMRWSQAWMFHALAEYMYCHSMACDMADSIKVERMSA